MSIDKTEPEANPPRLIILDSETSLNGLTPAKDRKDRNNVSKLKILTAVWALRNGVPNAYRISERIDKLQEKTAPLLRRYVRFKYLIATYDRKNHDGCTLQYRLSKKGQRTLKYLVARFVRGLDLDLMDLHPGRVNYRPEDIEFVRREYPQLFQQREEESTTEATPTTPPETHSNNIEPPPEQPEAPQDPPVLPPKDKQLIVFGSWLPASPNAQFHEIDFDFEDDTLQNIIEGKITDLLTKGRFKINDFFTVDKKQYTLTSIESIKVSEAAEKVYGGYGFSSPTDFLECWQGQNTTSKFSIDSIIFLINFEVKI